MRLILMRHAKSDWSGGLSDHARPLNARGQRTAPLVGQWLAEHGWAPTAVTSSDAARTHETWLIMATHFPEVEPQFTPGLYLAPARAIVARAATQAGDGPVLLLGHNPGMSEAVRWLCGVPLELKTADAALLEAPGEDWRATCTQPGGFTLTRHLEAREVAGDR